LHYPITSTFSRHSMIGVVRLPRHDDYGGRFDDALDGFGNIQQLRDGGFC
jgi:hypothetical protein